MMRPRIPVWQRRLMRPEFNGSQAGGPWTPGGTDSAPRAPGPRGLLNAPQRGPLHARTPYDRPGPRGPASSQVKIDVIPETQKQVLEMIDLAKKQLEIEREKIIKQFQNKPDNGSLPGGLGGPGRTGGPGRLGGHGGTAGSRDMPGLLGERPDGPVGIGMQRGGSVNDKPGLLGQRPDQKFSGPGMNPGDVGIRMNGIRPPMNGPQPLMSLRGLWNIENPRGPMAGPRGAGFGPLGPNPGPRGSISGANNLAGPRGAMSPTGLMGGPRQIGPMQGSGQIDGQALGGPRAIGPRGLNGPGPRPGGGGMSGSQGSTVGGMARPQRPGLGGVSGPQRPGIGDMRPPRPGMGVMSGPHGPGGGMSRPQGPGMGGMLGPLGPGGMSRQGPGMGGMSGPRGPASAGPGMKDSLLSRPQTGGKESWADWRSRKDPLNEIGGWKHDRSRLDPSLGADHLRARPGDRDYDLHQYDRVRKERIEDRRFQPLAPVDPLYPPPRPMYGDRGRDC